MKRLTTIIALVCMAFVLNATMAEAQSKQLKKDSKKEVKALEKEGWTILTGSGTLEYANLKFRTYVEENPDIVPIYGLAEGANVKIGRNNAVLNGIADYATRASAQVVGKIKSLTSADNNQSRIREIDKFAEAYQTAVNQKIYGIVKQHFVLVRDEGGRKMFRAYMSFNEKDAKRAREEAFMEANERASLEDLSGTVEDFIGEPVN